jgi:hypothetical protein
VWQAGGAGWVVEGPAWETDEAGARALGLRTAATGPDVVRQWRERRAPVVDWGTVKVA